jgi:tetratricopeptide (TPR) repeat protein
MLKKADLMIARRNYHSALEILNLAALYDSRNLDIVILKTDAYLALNQEKKAEELIKDTINWIEGDEKIELLFDLADVYDDYDQYDEVFQCLLLILKEEPNNEEALYKICFWADHTKRFEESIQIHNEIINEFPYNEIAWFNLGSAYHGLKLYEKAIDAYEYAIVIDENFDYAHRNKADAYIKLRQYEAAIEPLEKVIELNNSDVFILEALGLCNYKRKNFANSIAYYKEASTLAPESGIYQFKIAEVLMKQQFWVAAIQYIDSAIEINPKKIDFHIAKGECLVKLDSINEALQHFIIAVNLKPKLSQGWELLIKNLVSVGLLEDAKDQCFNALDKTEGKNIFSFYLCGCLLHLGKQKEALIQLEKALQEAPELAKKFIAFIPQALQNAQVVNILSRYKKVAKSKKRK